MNGIVVSDFELALKKLNIQVDDIKGNISNINKSFDSLTKNFKYNDLKFLTNKLNSQLKQFKNLIVKVNAYQTTANNVLLSYKSESEELTKNISRLSS